MWVSIHWKILIDLAISEYHCLTRHVIRLDILVSILHTSYFRFCDILNFVMSRGLLDRKRSQTKMTYVYTSISMTSSLKIEDLRVYITVHTILYYLETLCQMAAVNLLSTKELVIIFFHIKKHCHFVVTSHQPAS